MLGRSIRLTIAAGLIGVGFNLIMNESWGSRIFGIVCFIASALLFWAIFTGKFEDDKKHNQ